MSKLATLTTALVTATNATSPRRVSPVTRATAELRQVTSAVMNPSALAAAKKWSERLSDAQRKLAGKLAKELKRSGFSTGMFKDFASLGLKSFDMGSFLRMGQMPQATYKRIVDQTVEMLEMGAEAAHEKLAGDWPHLADAQPEGVNASTTWPVKVSFRGTKQPYHKDRMYNLYKGNMTVMLGTSSERSPVEFIASSGGLRHIKAPQMAYGLAEAAVFALLKDRALKTAKAGEEVHVAGVADLEKTVPSAIKFIDRLVSLAAKAKRELQSKKEPEREMTAFVGFMKGYRDTDWYEHFYT